MTVGSVKMRVFGVKKKVGKMHIYIIEVRVGRSCIYIYIYIYYRGARDGCGRWVGVRVEGELGRFPDGDLLW